MAWEQALDAPGVVRDPAPAPLCQLPWLARLRWRACLLRIGDRGAEPPGARATAVSAAGWRMAGDWCRRYGCVLGEA
jgi:hypothetical protein